MASANANADAHSPDGGELMSSIAAVRQLLMKDFSAEGQKSLANELSAVRESRYEDRMKFEVECQAQKDAMEDLKVKLVQAKREAQQEKAIRVSLEATNEALEQHKHELSSQLESYESSGGAATRETQEFNTEEDTAQKLRNLEAKLSDTTQEKEQAVKTANGWEIQCLALQRQMKELQIALESTKKWYQASQAQHKQALQRQKSSSESFQMRLDESIAARKKAEEDFQALSIAKTTAQPIVQENASTGTSKEEDNAKDQTLLDLEGQCETAETAMRRAEANVAALELELEALKRHRSTEDLEQEQEIKQKVSKKVASLHVSFDKMSKQAESLKKEMQDLQKKSPSKAAMDKMRKQKEILVMGMAKVGAVLESVETQLKDRLKLAKTKVEDCVAARDRAQDDLRLAKESMNEIQSELNRCRAKMTTLSKTTEDPTSSSQTSEVPVTTMKTPKTTLPSTLPSTYTMATKKTADKKQNTATSTMATKKMADKKQNTATTADATATAAAAAAAATKGKGATNKKRTNAKSATASPKKRQKGNK